MTKKNGAATKRKKRKRPGNRGNCSEPRMGKSARPGCRDETLPPLFSSIVKKDTPLTACLKGFCSKKEPVMSCLTENPAFFGDGKVLPDIFYPDGYGPSGL